MPTIWTCTARSMRWRTTGSWRTCTTRSRRGPPWTPRPLWELMVWWHTINLSGFSLKFWLHQSKQLWLSALRLLGWVAVTYTGCYTHATQPSFLFLCSQSKVTLGALIEGVKYVFNIYMNMLQSGDTIYSTTIIRSSIMYLYLDDMQKRESPKILEQLWQVVVMSCVP